jgi:hypothetical protein
MARVGKNMQVSEQRLAKKDSGEGTQQIQRDILSDLDALLEQDQHQQQQSQQQEQNSSSSQSRRPQQAQRRSGSKSGSTAGRQQGGSQPSANQAGNNAGGGGKEGSAEMNRIADLYGDFWGHLPEKARQEMDQYARERFMAKYSELLKQYYSTIAERGRRKPGE